MKTISIAILVLLFGTTAVSAAPPDLSGVGGPTSSGSTGTR
jgi:hypothetical protein